MANQVTLDTVQSLYVAYYGRPADPSGLQYWAERLEASDGNLGEIINAFGTSTEYTANLGSVDTAAQVNSLYQQLFGRDAEDEGLGFYTNMLNNGEKTLAEIALTIREAAQGTDRTTFEGRTTIANAFTRELDTQEEIEAYSTDRGVGIGRDYLKRVTEQTSSDDVLNEAAPVVDTLIPETPPSGEGTPTPPAITFTATLDDDNAVIFGGTATGAITLSESDGEWTFTRAGESSTLDSKSVVSSIGLGTAALTANASLLNNITVSGTGQLTLNGLSNDLDLSGLADALDVTATVTSDLDISENTHLDAIDSYEISSDATLTMLLSQYADTTLSGGGTFELNGTIAELLTAGAPLGDAAAITVSDAASIEQLEDLQALNSNLTYTSVKDTAQNIKNDVTDGGTGFIKAGVTVIVEDAIDIAGLAEVYTAVGEGSTVIADNLADDISELITNVDGVDVAHEYITEGTNVTINDNATVAQVGLIDAANGDGTLSFSLEDSYEHIAAADSDLLTSANAITLSDASYDIGERTVKDIQDLLALVNLKAANGETAIELSDLTYTLLDSSAALSSGGDNTADILDQATSVTANDAAYVYEARTIYERDNGAIYDISDNASAILSDATGTSDAVNQAGIITATGSVSAEQAQELYGIRADATMVYNVSDGFNDLTNPTYSAGVKHAINLTNTTSYAYGLDAADAQELVDLGNSGIVTLGTFQDSVSATNTFVGANARSSELSYDFRVYDSATHITTAIDNNTDFITGNPTDGFEGDARVQNIQVTGAFDVTGAEDLWTAVRAVFEVEDDIDDTVSTTAAKTTYTISDEIGNYTNELAAQEWVANADVRIITGTAEEISQAQNNSSNGSHNVFDLVNNSSQDRILINTGSEGRQTIVGGPGSNTIYVGDDHDTVTGGGSSDFIDGGAGYDYLDGGAGYDTINAGDGNDNVKGGSGNDTLNADSGNDVVRGGSGQDIITGGTGGDTLYGESGRDEIFAGASASIGSSGVTNNVTGGEDGDDMYGSSDADIFIYEGGDRNELIEESSTTYNTRDYLNNFSLGDKIDFQHCDDVQFFSSGSANASSVAENELGLSIRYEKNANVTNWEGTGTEAATRIFIDIAEQGEFDDIADMHIILVGSNIDINWDGSAITYGG